MQKVEGRQVKLIFQRRRKCCTIEQEKNEKRLKQSMQILDCTVEELHDPTGIVEGRRFEFQFSVQMDEEDELYHEGGTGLRVLYAVLDNKQTVLSYQFYDRATDRKYDFEWDEEEQQLIEQYCTEYFQA